MHMRKAIVFSGHPFLFIVAFLTFSFSASAQADSLLRLLASAKHDTTRIIYYGKLANLPGQELKQCVLYADSAIILAQNVSDKNYLGRAIKTKGEVFTTRAQPDSATSYFRQAIDIYTLTGNWTDLSMCYYSLGNAYATLEKYDLALESYIAGVGVSEKHKILRSNTYNKNGLATIYFKLKNYSEAKRAHLEALELSEEVGDPKLTGWIYTGLGNTMITVGQKDSVLIDSALFYFRNALASYSEANYLPGIAGAHNNIGVCFSFTNQFDSAIGHYRIAARTKHMYGELNGEVTALNNISQLYVLAKQADSAVYYATAARKIAEGLPALYYRTLAYGYTADAYALAMQFDSAYKYERLFRQFTDSINNQSQQEQLAEMQAKYDSEQQKQHIALLEKNNEIGTLYNYVFAAGGGIVLVIGIFIYMRYRSKKKANVLLEAQNIQITEQKKEITDSIIYAKKIQQALLATDSIVRNHVKDHFILYKPKDIVSGDFYWATAKNNSFWMAVCDSTGHGVPGAFMSLLNTTFLSEAINEKEINEPGEVFNFARKKLLENLAQDDSGESASNDGMDGTLLKISGNNVTYCGANGMAILVRNGEITELNTDKMPVGRSPREQTSFTSFEVNVHAGDVIYLFTDGYADQFGGDKGKKFKYRNLVQLLAVNSSRPSPEQKDILEKSHNKWKGHLEQIDDVLVVGLFF